MSYRGQSKIIFSALLMLTASACSLKDRQPMYGVSIDLPVSSNVRLGQGALNNASSSFTTPTSIGDFQCFALNITGPGLKSDPRFGCTDPSKNMGMIFGMVPVSGGKIDAMVPAGTARVIQLIGLQSSQGCPSFEDVLRDKEANGGNGMPGIGDPYLLASATVDVFGDVTVNMQASFDPNAKLFQGCDSGGGGTQELTFQKISDTPILQKGQCVRLPVEAHINQDLTAPLSVKPLIVSATGGSVGFFTDSVCTAAYNSNNFLTISAGGARYLEMYVLADTSATAFTAKVETTATGWLTPETTFSLVSNRIEIMAPSPAPPNAPGATTCNAMNLSGRDQVGSFLNLPTGPSNLYDLYVYNNSTNGSTLSTIEMYYTAAECSSQTNVIPSVANVSGDKRKKFVIELPASATQIFVRNAVAESLSVGLSKQDNTYQGAITSVSFLPYALAASTPVPSITQSFAGGSPLTIGFLSNSAPVVTAIRVGNLNCPITARDSSSITCTIPASTTEGWTQVNIAVGSAVYPVMQYAVHYYPFQGGSGTAADPFHISTIAEFKSINYYSWLYFRQVNALDFASVLPNAGMPFFVSSLTGGYNGNALNIFNLGYPLFGSCNGIVQQVSVSGASIFGSGTGYMTGAICGTLQSSGQINGVSVSGDVSNAFANGPNDAVGSIAGQSYGIISNSRSSATVTAGVNAAAGGLVGQLESSGFVTDSVFTGSVTDGYYAGGVVGVALTGGSIIQSGSTGAINGVSGSGVGGLIGKIGSGGGTLISRSFASGNVTGVDRVGGFVGHMMSGQIEDSFALGNVSATSNAGGFVGRMEATAMINRSYTNAQTLSGSPKGGFVGSFVGGTNTDVFFRYVSTTDPASVPSLANSNMATYVDNLANYTNYSGAFWKAQVGTPTGAVNKTPVLSWMCSHASLTSMALTCQP